MRSWQTRKAAGIAALFISVAIPVALWAWNHVRHPMGNQFAADAASQFLAYGRLAGLIAGIGALLQILLLTRAKWIESVFGFDRLARLHHILGFTLLAALLAHPALVLAGHSERAGVSMWEQYRDFFRTWDGVGAAAFGLYLMLLALASSAAILIWRARYRYEIWYGTHLLLYAAVALTVDHMFEVGTDFTSESPWMRWYWIALLVFVAANLAWYRVMRPCAMLLKHRFVVTGVRNETPDVTSVLIGGRGMDRFCAKAGQFVIVRFLAPGFRREAHPFSISNTPDGGGLRLTIKALGDFTRRIPSLRVGTPVLIDGPHGVLTANRCVATRVLLVAGGIGITPLRALVGEFLAAGRETVLLYANRRPELTALRGELDEMAAGSGGRFRVVHVMNEDPAWPGEKGRVDKEKIARLVPDASERDVFLCGPPPMMESVRRVLRELGVPRNAVHWERFSL